MAINDVLKDMYKKNTGKELTEEAHNVEDTLKAINRDIPLGGGGMDLIQIVNLQYMDGEPEFDSNVVCSYTYGQLYAFAMANKIVQGWLSMPTGHGTVTMSMSKVMYYSDSDTYGITFVSQINGDGSYYIIEAFGHRDDTCEGTLRWIEAEAN